MLNTPSSVCLGCYRVNWYGSTDIAEVGGCFAQKNWGDTKFRGGS